MRVWEQLATLARSVSEVKFDSDAYEMKCWYRDLRQPGRIQSVFLFANRWHVRALHGFPCSKV